MLMIGNSPRVFRFAPRLFTNDDFLRVQHQIAAAAYLVRDDSCGSPLYPAPPTGKGASYGRVIVCLLAPKGQAKQAGILTEIQTKVNQKTPKRLATGD